VPGTPSVPPASNRASNPASNPASTPTSTQTSPPVARAATPTDARLAPPPDVATTLAAGERPGTAELAVAPASAIAVAERPSPAARDRVAPASRPDVSSPPNARDPMTPDRAAPPTAHDAATRGTDRRTSAPGAPELQRDAAAPDEIVLRRPEPFAKAAPAEIVRRQVEAPAPAPTAEPNRAGQPDPAVRAEQRQSAPRVQAHEGFVVRRLGEVAPRSDTASLPVRPAARGRDVEPLAAPAAPVGTTLHGAAPTVAPTVPPGLPLDDTADRVTAADLARLRTRPGRPAAAEAGDSNPANAPSPAIVRSPALPPVARPTVHDGANARTPPAATAVPPTASSAAARVPVSAADQAASSTHDPPPDRDVTRKAGHRDVPAAGDDTVGGDRGVRPPAALAASPSRAVPTPGPATPAMSNATITRALLRRTLDARQPVRRRVAPLANAGLTATMPAATEPGGASAIEAVMHADAATDVAQQPIAERFMTELSRQRTPRPQPLPAQFHEMSHVIAGTPEVRVSTDAVSRRALRSVGKVAATVNDVIHLDRAIGRVRPDVIAHELTHVAHRSPEPRFFDDDRPSREEQRAEAVAKLMRSSAPSIVRRSPTSGGSPGSHSAPGAEGTVSADALAASITARQHTDTIRREPDWTATRPRNQRRGPQLGSARSSASSGPPAPSSPAPAPAPPEAVGGFRIDDHFDRIVELLQDRVLAELERRGGRLRGGF
jgi:Domain of unknown function (DUF4157)